MIPSSLKVSVQASPSAGHRGGASVLSPMCIAFVLSKFTRKPEVLAKSFKTPIAPSIDFSFLGNTKVKSSENCSGSTFIPLISSLSMCLVALSFIARYSTTNMKMYADTGSPCGTPCSSGNLSVECPAIVTSENLSRNSRPIPSINFGPKPNFLRASKMKSWSTESNALLKSTKRIVASILSIFA